MEAKNHSTSITVNQVKVILSSEKFNDYQGFGTFFPTFNDLKPGQTLKVESLHEFEKMIADSFPANTVDYADLGNRKHPFYDNEKHEKYPANLTIEFLPRITGGNYNKKGRRDIFACKT